LPDLRQPAERRKVLQKRSVAVSTNGKMGEVETHEGNREKGDTVEKGGKRRLLLPRKIEAARHQRKKREVF